jgi:hypothetical protein
MNEARNNYRVLGGDAFAKASIGMTEKRIREKYQDEY